MTGRGWWCLFLCLLMVILGVLRDIPALTLSALLLVLYLSFEAINFTLRTRTLLRSIRVSRRVCDVNNEKTELATLWAGRQYVVQVRIWLDAAGNIPLVFIADAVPFAVQHDSGETTVDGELSDEAELVLKYRIDCPQTGAARFEGVRVELSDLQGFFGFATFLRFPVMLPILPAVLIHRGGGPISKSRNELPPPGIHRLRSPGSGSELLELRDYVPGDPPRTIAWKISARKDKLISKDFESEVPLRCTLFVDVSSSVRVPSPAPSKSKNAPSNPNQEKPIDRVIELAAGVIRQCQSVRDLVGVCLFDENASRMVRPERSSNHHTQLLQILADAACLGPVAFRADPLALMPVANALARELYPDLMNENLNRMPTWLTWLVGFPRYTRHFRNWVDRLNRTKRLFLLWCTTLLPILMGLGTLLALWLVPMSERMSSVLIWTMVFAMPTVATIGWAVFWFSLLISWRVRRDARIRKRLSAVMCVVGQRHGGELQALLEDDDLFALRMQEFLNHHQVPIAVELYDERGKYLFAVPEKMVILSKGLLDAVARGRDNELFVILADVLELDDALSPLLQAVRVALARHHQVLMVCPWPRAVPLPGEPLKKKKIKDLATTVQTLAQERLHEAYARIAKAFARLGVQVLCAADDTSVPVIITRLEQMRSHRSTVKSGGRS
jgi:uncharacterized protein (DUF58 family)